MDGAVPTIQVGLIVLFAFAFSYRLWPVIRKPQDRVSRAVVCALACLEWIFLLGHPDLYRLVYRALGEVPALPQLLQHVAAVVMTFFSMTFVILVATPVAHANTLARRMRNQRRLLVACLTCLLVCYALGPLRLGLPMLDPAGSPDISPDISIVAYVVSWQSYLAIALVGTVRLGLRHVFTGRLGLRVGLRLLLIGYVLALLNILHKTGYQLAVYFGLSPPWLESGSEGVQLFLLAPVVACLVIGLLLPSVCVKVGRRLAWRRAYQQMAPLARALDPRLATSAWMRPRGARARVQSRIVGIRDALIGPFRGYLDPDVLRLALDQAKENGAEDDQAQVIAEAACIAMAVERRTNGLPPLDSTPPALTAPPDWESEMRWLAMVSQAYTSDSLVQELVKGFAGGLRTPGPC